MVSAPDAALELFGLTEQRLELLKRTIARGTTDDEFQLFLHVCKTRKVDPFSKLVYPVKRWDKKIGSEVMALQSSIDYFRLTADRTGKYAGQLGPQWRGAGDGDQWTDVWLKQGPPAAARVGILRHDFKEPLWTVALWSAYAQTDKNGNLTQFWARMGPLMLAKCAEALGLRRAFPEDLSGLYVAEEMEQATSGQAAPAPAPAPQLAPRGLDDLAREEFGARMEQRGAPPVEVLNTKTGEVVQVAAEPKARKAKAKPAGPAPEPPPPIGNAAVQVAAIEEASRQFAETQAKYEEARQAASPKPKVPEFLWYPTPEKSLEVPFAVSCGFWDDWKDTEIPSGSALAIACKGKGPATWRTAAQGKKTGGRHAILLDLTMRASKYLAEGQTITVNHHRAVCTLQILLEGSERAAAGDPAPAGAELPFE